MNTDYEFEKLKYNLTEIDNDLDINVESTSLQYEKTIRGTLKNQFCLIEPNLNFINNREILVQCLYMRNKIKCSEDVEVIDLYVKGILIEKYNFSIDKRNFELAIIDEKEIPLNTTKSNSRELKSYKSMSLHSNTSVKDSLIRSRHYSHNKSLSGKYSKSNNSEKRRRSSSNNLNRNSNKSYHSGSSRKKVGKSISPDNYNSVKSLHKLKSSSSRNIKSTYSQDMKSQKSYNYTNKILKIYEVSNNLKNWLFDFKMNEKSKPKPINQSHLYYDHIFKQLIIYPKDKIKFNTITKYFPKKDILSDENTTFFYNTETQYFEKENKEDKPILNIVLQISNKDGKGTFEIYSQKVLKVTKNFKLENNNVSFETKDFIFKYMGNLKYECDIISVFPQDIEFTNEFKEYLIDDKYNNKEKIKAETLILAEIKMKEDFVKASKQIELRLNLLRNIYSIKGEIISFIIQDTKDKIEKLNLEKLQKLEKKYKTKIYCLGVPSKGQFLGHNALEENFQYYIENRIDSVATNIIRNFNQKFTNMEKSISELSTNMNTKIEELNKGLFFNVEMIKKSTEDLKIFIVELFNNSKNEKLNNIPLSLNEPKINDQIVSLKINEEEMQINSIALPPDDSEIIKGEVAALKRKRKRQDFDKENN